MAETKTKQALRTAKFGLLMGSHVQVDPCDGKERMYSAMRGGVRVDPVFESTRDLAKRDPHKFIRLNDTVKITPEKGELMGKDKPPDTSDLIQDDGPAVGQTDDGYDKLSVEELLTAAKRAEINVGQERDKTKLIKMLRDAHVLA